MSSICEGSGKIIGDLSFDISELRFKTNRVLMPPIFMLVYQILKYQMSNIKCPMISISGRPQPSALT
jgi:hypothetical protein